MAVIRTYKLKPTDTRGERIRVRYGSDTLTLPYSYEQSDPHRSAAQELAEKVHGEGTKITQIRGHWTPTGYQYRTV